MRTEPPIPKELWDTIPPAAQAALLVAFEHLEQRVELLEREIADLNSRLKTNHQPDPERPNLTTNLHRDFRIASYPPKIIWRDRAADVSDAKPAEFPTITGPRKVEMARVSVPGQVKKTLPAAPSGARGGVTGHRHPAP